MDVLLHMKCVSSHLNCGEIPLILTTHIILFTLWSENARFQTQTTLHTCTSVDSFLLQEGKKSKQGRFWWFFLFVCLIQLFYYKLIHRTRAELMELVVAL